MSAAELADARGLVELYDRRCDLAHALATSTAPTGALAQAVLDKGRELDAACEEFRKTYYPRKAECFVGLWSVVVASPTRRSVVTVLDLADEYTGNKVSA